MSSMLEQAIADAATLREQAIKNAEQSAASMLLENLDLS